MTFGADWLLIGGALEPLDIAGKSELGSRRELIALAVLCAFSLFCLGTIKYNAQTCNRARSTSTMVIAVGSMPCLKHFKSM